MMRKVMSWGRSPAGLIRRTRLSVNRVPVTRDDGNAIIEFLVIGVLILIPMAYLVICVMQVQAATFAATQAVREAGRAFSSADSLPRANAAAQMAARLAFEDQGLVLPASALHITCAGAPCLTPGGVAEVALAWNLELPWLPASLGSRASVPISVQHLVPIDDYRVSS